MNPFRFASSVRQRLTVSFFLCLGGITSALAAEPYQLTKAEISTLAREAPAALAEPLATVIDKPQASPSGDAHDYVSFARYFWPDPEKADGLPYVQRDGQHNLEQVARGDHKRLWAFCLTVEKLAAAWQLNRDEPAARRAGEWLRAWFIAPATRMNPHLENAQVRLGHNQNRGNEFGVLDARCFAQLVDAILLLEDSPAFTAGELTQIREWFANYSKWLTTSENGRAARATHNNHSTWYLAHAIPVVRFAGNDALARELCEEAKILIARQIKPDGSQPGELSRVDALGYSFFNLEALFHVATLAQGLGLDLWNYQSPEGSSLRGAIDFLRPFNANPESFSPDKEAKVQPGFLDPLLVQADAVWGKPPAS